MAEIGQTISTEMMAWADEIIKEAVASGAVLSVRDLDGDLLCGFQAKVSKGFGPPGELASVFTVQAHGRSQQEAVFNLAGRLFGLALNTLRWEGLSGEPLETGGAGAHIRAPD